MPSNGLSQLTGSSASDTQAGLTGPVSVPVVSFAVPANATTIIASWAVVRDGLGPTCAGDIFGPDPQPHPLRFSIPRDGSSAVCDVQVEWVFIVPDGSSAPSAAVTGKAGRGV